jgi:hypothetical protein
VFIIHLFEASQYERELQSVFKHMDWVRCERGIYSGNLALVWYPLKDGKVCEQYNNVNLNLVTVLVVPREDVDANESIEDGGSPLCF